MSYCVNCGVELAAGEKICPLCFTEAINPRQPYKSPDKPNYPNVPVSGYKRGFRELLAPLALLMMIPVVTSLIADILTSNDVTWSGYIALSIMLSGIYIFPPLAFRRPRLLLCLGLDVIGAGIFIYFIDILSGGGWFWGMGLPVLAIAGALILSLASIYTRAPLNIPAKLGITLFAVSVFVVCIELLLDINTASRIRISWSLYVFAPLVILGLCCLLVSRNRRIKESMRKALHY